MKMFLAYLTELQLMYNKRSVGITLVMHYVNLKVAEIVMSLYEKSCFTIFFKGNYAVTR